VLIPESVLPPHRVILNQEGVRNQYYIRSGSSSVVASHAQLEDMFGRRPRPKLELSARWEYVREPDVEHREVRLTLGITNAGRGSARAPLIRLMVHSPYELSRHGLDGNGAFGLPELVVARGSAERWFGGSANDVVHPGVVHEVAAIDISVDVRSWGAYNDDLFVDYMIAAENCRPVEGRMMAYRRELWETADRLEHDGGRLERVE